MLKRTCQRVLPARRALELMQRISADRLGERLPPESVPSELAPLAAAFNDMLARLQDSFRRLSDFSSDLAHELRTPISNLMTQTQVALAKARTADEYREIGSPTGRLLDNTDFADPFVGMPRMSNIPIRVHRA